MRIKPDQLGSAVQKSLASVYLISGDEPLQLAEAADDIRQAARQAGYAIREVISIDKGDEWRQLTVEANTLSVFTEKKLIDLRLPSAKPGVEGGKALIAYCKDLPEDTLLLITAGKLENSATKAQWFQALDNSGVIVQVWPLQGPELLHWLQARALRRGMRFDNDALKSLAAKIEGNLQAAAQEIEKLYILHGQALIIRNMVEDDVADSARFDVFKLVDSLMQGKLNRAIKILHSLKVEGIAAPVVLWALTREARTLFNIKHDLTAGRHQDEIFKSYQIWDKRRQAFQDGLARLKSEDLLAILQLSAITDQCIKGQQAGDSWEKLFAICLLYVKV